MYAELEKRPIRHFAIYREKQLALVVEDRPGRLISSGSPSPDGAPTHRFIHGQAFDAMAEGALAAILKKAKHFDHYLALLIAEGYALRAVDGPLELELEKGLFLFDNGSPVGVIWKGAGQFSAQEAQPAPGKARMHHAHAVVYDPDEVGELYQLLSEEQHWDFVRIELEGMGYDLKLME